MPVKTEQINYIYYLVELYFVFFYSIWLLFVFMKKFVERVKVELWEGDQVDGVSWTVEILTQIDFPIKILFPFFSRTHRTTPLHCACASRAYQTLGEWMATKLFSISFIVSCVSLTNEIEKFVLNHWNLHSTLFIPHRALLSHKSFWPEQNEKESKNWMNEGRKEREKIILHKHFLYRGGWCYCMLWTTKRVKTMRISNR